MLILFYDTAWGQPPDTSGIPSGFEFTTDRRHYADATAVVFHIPDWTIWSFTKLTRTRWLAPKKLPGQLWVAWSMECEEIYPLLRDDRFMRRFDVTMTYRLDADVPTTYVGFYESSTLAQVMRQPPRPKLSGALAASFISSHINHSGREQYIRKLARHLTIDSFGRFMHNKSLAHDRGRESKLEAIASYKFTLAFENARCRDYVTEKFFDPLVAGSVPVYLGAPNVQEFAPGDHCFINTADFPEPHRLAEFLKALDNDDAAYQAYFAWKKKPFRPAFQYLVTLEAQQPLARLCELIQAPGAQAR